MSPVANPRTHSSLRKDGRKKVFWKPEEEGLLIAETADLLLKGGKLSMGQALAKAQKILPAERQRPEHSVRYISAVNFAPAITKELERRQKERAEEKLRAEEKPSGDQPVPTPVVDNGGAVALVHPAPPAVIEEGKFTPIFEVAARGLIKDMEHALNGFTEAFKGMLRTRLNDAALEVVTEMGNNIKVRTEDHVREVGVLNLNGNEVRADMVKVGYIGGGQKGNDLFLLKQGLDDVYRFVTIDSLTQLDSVRNSHVLIKSKYCSHSLWKGARMKAPDAKLVTDELTPMRINELLTEWYVHNALPGRTQQPALSH